MAACDTSICAVHGLGTRDVWGDGWPHRSPSPVPDGFRVGRRGPPLEWSASLGTKSTSSLSLFREDVHESIQRVTHTSLQWVGLLFYPLPWFPSSCFLWLVRREVPADKHVWAKQAFSLTSASLGVLLRRGHSFCFGHSSLLTWLIAGWLFSFSSPLGYNLFPFGNVIAISRSHTFWCGCQGRFESLVTQRSPALVFEWFG